jgi:signal transduction histidine kinase
MKRDFFSKGFVASFPSIVKRLLFFNYSRGVQATHQDLLDSRCSRAMAIGIIVYVANIIEPWLRFHDPNVIKLQMGAALLIALVFLSSLTTWGGRHKLTLLVAGLLIGTAGFEAVVCTKHAFDTEYSDGFPVLFAYYTVFVPTTVFQSALVGIAIFLVLAVPATIATVPQTFGKMLISNLTAFILLLCGRYIANSLWEREAAARERESAFVSALSHEFGNSLTVLCMTAKQLNAGELANPTSQSTAYRTLFEESDRLQSQIRRLLDFGRVEAGIARLQFTTIDPIELVNSVVREFEENPTSSRYQINVEVRGEVPLVKGDEVALRSMFRNLLDNAVKYSPNIHEAWVSVGREKDHAVITVRDRGIGIKEEERDNIFEAFVRGSAVRDGSTRGTGIGLALVKNIVLSHGGAIDLESKENEGSIFTVKLPEEK